MSMKKTIKNYFICNKNKIYSNIGIIYLTLNAKIAYSATVSNSGVGASLAPIVNNVNSLLTGNVGLLITALSVVGGAVGMLGNANKMVIAASFAPAIFVQVAPQLIPALAGASMLVP